MNKLYFSICLSFVMVVTVASCDQSESSPGEIGYKKTLMSKSHLKAEVKKIVLPEYGVKCSFLDHNGKLWFGTNRGVYSYNGHSFEYFSEDDGLCNNQVYSIIEDTEYNLWFGTQNGLCTYDRKTFRHVPIPFQDTSGIWLDKVYPIINPNAVHSLNLDQNGSLWLGTGGGGVYFYDGSSFISYLKEIGKRQEDGLYHNWVPSITTDAEGNIWFASMTHGGVSRFNGETFVQFMPNDGLSDDMIRTIFKDSSGKMWFGFNGNRKSGLTYFDGKSFYTYTKEDGLCSKRVLAIYEDQKGNLWLGGTGNLCLFNGIDFTEFTSKDGQRFAGILFIINDQNGNIWFGGQKGLWKFDGETVVEMAK